MIWQKDVSAYILYIHLRPSPIPRHNCDVSTFTNVQERSSPDLLAGAGLATQQAPQTDLVTVTLETSYTVGSMQLRTIARSRQTNARIIQASDAQQSLPEIKHLTLEDNINLSTRHKLLQLAKHERVNIVGTMHLDHPSLLLCYSGG